MAGKDWVKFFLVRHPNLIIRVLEAIIGARVIGFNKAPVDEYHVTGDRI